MNFYKKIFTLIIVFSIITLKITSQENSDVTTETITTEENTSDRIDNTVSTDENTATNATILDPIPVVASPLTESTNDKVSIHDIRRRQSVDPGQAASLMNGVELVRKGGIAHDVILRGRGRDAVSMTLDGQKLWGACPNRMDPPLFHVDFAQVEALTLTRGPYDVTQPGAEAGSIDIETKSPLRMPGAAINAAYGSFNYIMGSIEGHGGTNFIQAQAGISHRQSDVYSDGNGDTITSIEGKGVYKENYQKKNQLAYTVDTVFGKINLNPAEGHNVLFAGSFQDSKDTLYPYLLMDAPRDEFGSGSVNYTIDSLGKFKQTTFKAYGNKVVHLMDNNFRASADKMLMSTYAVHQTLGAGLHTTYNMKNASFKTGLDFYSRNYDADNRLQSVTMASMKVDNGNFIPDVTTQNMGFFGEYQRNLTDSIDMIWGFRGDLANSKAADDNLSLRQKYHNESSNEANFTMASANLQVNYEPLKGLTWFTGIANGNRLPDATELFASLQKMSTSPNWVGNSTLKNEQKTEFDTGIQFINKMFATKITFFTSQVKNFIASGQAAKPDSAMATSMMNKPAQTYYNTDAVFYGSEAELQVFLPVDLMWFAQAAFTRGEKEKGDHFSDTDIGEISPLTGSTGLRYEKKGFYTTLSGQFAAAQNFIDTDLNETATSAWGIANMTAGYEADQYSVGIKLNNILNAHYFTHLASWRNPFSSNIKLAEPGFNATLHASYEL